MHQYAELYKNELLEAIKKTVNEKYFIPERALSHLGKYKNFLSIASEEELKLLFWNKYSTNSKTIDLSEIKGRCIKCHSEMKEVITDYLRIRPFLTIGYVTYAGKEMYKFNSMSKELLRTKENSVDKVADIHVWLTLPSMEILDFTFFAHFVYVNSDETVKMELKRSENFVFHFGDADLLYEKNKIVYHPVYVGSDVLKKNSLIHAF